MNNGFSSYVVNLTGSQNLIMWCVPQWFSYHCSFLIKMPYCINWHVLQMDIVWPEIYKLRRGYWASLTGFSFYEWMFIGVNCIILYIYINLFQHQLFHNFEGDQGQDEKLVITLVILFTVFWNWREGGGGGRKEKTPVFYFSSSFPWGLVKMGSSDLQSLFKLLLPSYQRVC